MEQRGGRQGALTARCGGAGACVEPRWQPEENDRGGARPVELLGQPSVTYYRGSARLTRTRDGNGPDLILSHGYLASARHVMRPKSAAFKGKHLWFRTVLLK